MRNERTAPLEFTAENGNVYNKGLLWTGAGPTKQLLYRAIQIEFFSRESIDIARDQDFSIQYETVLSTDSLGMSIVIVIYKM